MTSPKSRVIEMKMNALPLEQEEGPAPLQAHHTPHSPFEQDFQDQNSPRLRIGSGGIRSTTSYPQGS